MKGSYILIIRIPKEIEILVGKLGRIEFREGFYAYVGSAMNGLDGRIQRHLREKKRKFWHIDYLLEKAEIVDIFILESKRRIECDIAKNLAKIFRPVRRFGSSDCTCEGHLFSLDAELPNHLAEAIKVEGKVKHYAQHFKTV